jgi:uncharacterized coiled-coil DUF342 family protein
MFNVNLLTDEERKTVLELCESINKQRNEINRLLRQCEELRKTLDSYKEEANSGS